MIYTNLEVHFQPSGVAQGGHLTEVCTSLLLLETLKLLSYDYYRYYRMFG